MVDVHEQELEEFKIMYTRKIVKLQAPFYFGCWEDGQFNFSFTNTGDLEKNARQKFSLRQTGDYPEQQISLKFDFEKREINFEAVLSDRLVKIILPTQLSKREDFKSVFYYFPDDESVEQAKKLTNPDFVAARLVEAR